MVVTKNSVTGNTMITLDDGDLELVNKAMWDEQLLYYGLLKDGKWTSNEQEREWEERLVRLNNMALVLGAGVLKQFDRRNK